MVPKSDLQELLHYAAEIPLDIIVYNDHGFAEQRAHFGAAYVKYVAQRRDVFKRGHIARTHQRRAQPRPVQKQQQIFFLASWILGLT